MRTYLLFVYGIFDDPQDIDFFCSDVIAGTKGIEKVRNIVEIGSNNIIVIFSSELDQKTLSEELHNSITVDVVKFYFLFDRDDIFSANMPLQMRDFLFNDSEENTALLLEYNNNNPKTKNEITNVNVGDLDLDVILDKIEQFGVESLTPYEKNFLDSFKN